MLTLGIETSCDETAAAVLRDDKVLSNIVSSQIDIHKKYGGVVPELASREHLKNVMPIIREALAAADISLKDIHLIAVTYTPGLIGALLVGVSVAKAIAYAQNIPFIGVHHGEGHILAAHIEYPGIGYPYVALLVSGGHTALYHVKGLGKYKMLGQTRDDAAGEAYDKVAKLLGLEYPGGPILDRLAQKGNSGAVTFPRGHLAGYDFSFSGLKTAVRNHVALFMSKDKGIDPSLNINNVAASFQAAVVETLVEKTMLAASETGVNKIVVAGGVAANSSLRKRMNEEASKQGITLYLPNMALCIDNAAMIALAGYLHFKQGKRSNLDLNPRPTMPL
jgi:N6-L-threonylcarbamoyladenine synthase